MEGEATHVVNGGQVYRTLILPGGLLVAATLLLLLLPSTVTVRVGDDATRIHAIGRMGYAKSQFSLARRIDADGRIAEPSAYSIGGGWHLLIWHKDRIERMTHFRHESLGPGRYGEWHDVRKVESFTVSRPSIGYYFVGLGIALAVGALLVRFTRTFYVLLIVYCSLGLIAVLTVSAFAETLALDPFLRFAGLASGAVIGRRLRILLTVRRAGG